jgi:hypothetical protein
MTIKYFYKILNELKILFIKEIVFLNQLILILKL